MKFLPGITLLLVTLLFSAHLSFAQQDYYWVGGSGNWSDVSHWATTSGGATLHTVAPTFEDDVYFDGSSFSGSGQSVAVDEIAECHDMDWTGATSFPALNASFQMDIHGSVLLNTDVIYNFKDVNFKTIDLGESIVTNGSSFGTSSVLKFDGDGGWSLGGSLEAKTINFIKGTFSTANFDITTSGTIYIYGTLGTLLDISLGSSTISCQTFWNSGPSDLEFDAGTSEIVTGFLRGDQYGNGPFTYYDVTFNSGGALYNSNIIHNVEVTMDNLVIESGSVQMLTSLVVIGNKYDLIDIYSSTLDSEGTISINSGIIGLQYVELKDIHAIGTASFNATNSIDHGNNDGWNITAPTIGNYYWIGDGGDWDDPAHWVTSSGGSTIQGDYPGPHDNVFFDANSFTVTGQQVNIDIPVASTKDLDWTGVTNNPTIYAPYESNLQIHGNAYFKDGVTKSIYNASLYGDDQGLEIFYGAGQINNFYFYGTGEYTFTDNIVCSNIGFYGGTVNFGGVNVSVNFSTSIQGSKPVVVNMGSSSISTRDFTLYSFGSITLNAESSVITISKDLIGGGETYNHVIFSGDGKITGENTFNELELKPGATIDFEKNITQTITTFTLTGGKSSPITLNSTEPGTQATVSVASGIVNGIYLILQDINATGGATFNADQAIDNGNNSGWTISPVSAQDYFWVGGSGDWSDFENHWATTSGGATFHLGEPGVLDDVYFDASSFSANSEEVTINLNSISMHNLDMSGIDDSASFLGDKIINIYGSIYISEIAQFYPDEIHLLSTDAETVIAKNSYLTNAAFNIDGSGTFSLMDSLLIRYLNINGGTLETGGQYVHVNFETKLGGSSGILLDLGTSEFFSRSFSNGDASNYTIDASQAKIIISSTFSPDYSNENNVTINELVISQYNSTDNGSVYGNMSVEKLTVEAGSPITIQSGTTLTAGEIVMLGTSELPIILSSTSEGEAGTLSQASGIIDAEYLQIKDNIATGGATFNAYSSLNLGNTSGWTFFKSDQVINFPAIEDKNYDDEPFALGASTVSGLEIIYEVISGPASVEGDILTLDGVIGIVQVKASQPGNIDFFPAASVIRTFEVTGFVQEIIFPDIDDLVYGDGPVSAAAFSSLGIQVEFSSSDPDVGDIFNNQFVIAGVGQTTITAFQSGNDSTAAADPVEISVTVSKAPLTITANNVTLDYGVTIPELTYSIEGFVYDETEVDLLTPVVISANGSDVGEYPIEVSGATSDNYDITFVDATLTIQIIDQVITFEVPAEVDISTTALLLAPTSTSDLDILLEVISGPAILNGNSLIFSGTGEIIVIASQDGDLNHHAAEDVQVSVLVTDATKTDQTITFNTISGKVYGDVFEISPTASSGLGVALTVSRGPAVITGNSVKITGVGSITIRAAQSGDDQFNPAIAVSKTFNSTKASLAIAAEDKSRVFGEANPALTMEIGGFVNGDDESDITLPSISTTALTTSDAGAYPIVLAGGSSGLYTLNLTNGTLTVEKAEATINISNLEQESDGSIKVPTIVTDPAGLNVTVTYNGTSDLPSAAGEYSVLASINNTNYFGEASATFILISNDVLATSIPNPSVSIFPNPTNEFLSIEGIVSGNFTLLDLHGKTLMEQKITPMVKVSGLSDGQYLLILRDDQKNEVTHLRLVIRN